MGFNLLEANKEGICAVPADEFVGSRSRILFELFGTSEAKLRVELTAEVMCLRPSSLPTASLQNWELGLSLSPKFIAVVQYSGVEY